MDENVMTVLATKTEDELVHALELNKEQQVECAWEIYVRCREIKQKWNLLQGFEKEEKVLVNELTRRHEERDSGLALRGKEQDHND